MQAASLPPLLTASDSNVRHDRQSSDCCHRQPASATCIRNSLRASSPPYRTPGISRRGALGLNGHSRTVKASHRHPSSVGGTRGNLHRPACKWSAFTQKGPCQARAFSTRFNIAGSC